MKFSGRMVRGFGRLTGRTLRRLRPTAKKPDAPHLSVVPPQPAGAWSLLSRAVRLVAPPPPRKLAREMLIEAFRLRPSDAPIEPRDFHVVRSGEKGSPEANGAD